MNGGAASSDESEDSGSGAEMEQLNLEAVAVKQQIMDYGRVFVVGIPVKEFRRWGVLIISRKDRRQKKVEDIEAGQLFVSQCPQDVFCNLRSVYINWSACTIPKNPGMPWERDYTYIPILRMGLGPSILF